MIALSIYYDENIDVASLQPVCFGSSGCTRYCFRTSHVECRIYTLNTYG